MQQKSRVSMSMETRARRRKLFKPLIQAPIVAFIFILNAAFVSAWPYSDQDFDLNKLMMVVTPDHFPILWNHAQKYPIDFSDTSGIIDCEYYLPPPEDVWENHCPTAAVNAGADSYKTFQNVPGYGRVTVYYKWTGSEWEVVGTVADLDNDGWGDNTDTDIDGDGVNNDQDEDPHNPDLWDSETQDTDNDGVPDAYDAYPYDASKVTDIVGKMPGEFSVSESGSATYSLPIKIPPGRGGLIPEIALGYDNQSGNGYMGMGWNLLGLSAITRCVPDSRSYGFNRIKFDGSDKLCLDGQQLIETGTGSDSYGSYKQYRTQVDNLSRIRSYGNTSTGPTSFRVWTRSGRLMEYGVSSSTDDELRNGAQIPASRVEAQGRSQVLVWALNKVSDSSGNYFTVSYHEDAANGEYYPLSIHYAGNSNQGLAPFNSIVFEYESRPDPSLHYVAGSVEKMTVRMSGVKIFSNGELVKRYKLFYGSMGIDKSVLKSIIECDAQNKCLSPLSFEWSGGGEGTFVLTQNGPDIYIGSSLSDATEDVSRVRFGDFNGDGKADVYRLNGTEYSYPEHGLTVPPAEMHDAYLSNGDGSFNRVDGARFPILNFAGIHAGNFACPGSLGGDDCVYEVRPSMTWHNSPFASNPGYQGGPNDLICMLGNNCGGFGNSYATPGTGPLTPVTPPELEDPNKYNHFLTDITRVKFGFFSSPGRLDVYYVRGYDSTEAGTVFMGNTPQNTGPSFHIRGDHDYARFDIARVMFADFNGDRLSDLYRVNGWDANAAPSIYFSDGDGTFTSAGNGPVMHIGNNIERGYTDLGRIKFGDFNGDGLSDVMLIKSHNNTVNSHIYISKGDGTFEQKTTGPATYVGESIESAKVDVVRVKLGDFNGDGMTDVYYVRGWDSIENSNLFFSKGDGTFIMKAGGPVMHIGNNTERALIDIGRINLDDFNGDGMTDIYRMVGHGDAPGDRVYFSQSKPILLHKVGKAGEGQITVDYKSVKANSISRSLSYVVSKVSTDNGVGGMASKSYSYGSLRVKRSQLAFTSMTVTDDQTGIKTEAQYDTDTHFGFVTFSEQRKPDNFPIRSTKYFYDGLPSEGITPECAPGNLEPVCKLVEKIYDFDNSSTTPLTTVITTTSYDAYGNARTVEVKTEGAGGPFTTTTVNDYDADDPDIWRLGRLTRSTVTKTASGNPNSIRGSAFNYDPGTGFLIREVIEPDKGANIRLTTAYKRDGFGNITHTTLCEGSIEPNGCDENTPIPTTGAGVRRTITSYASNSPDYPAGVFPTGVTNALGHVETRIYDARFGLVKSVTGPNGLTTTSQYDSFGRKIFEERADGTQTSISYTFCSPNCPTVGGVTAQYKVTTASTGSAPSTVYFDAFDREIRRSSPGFDSPSIANDELIYVDTQYDSRGRTKRVSEPYFAGAPPAWTEYGYDDINRVTVLNQSHTTANVLTDYNGLTTIVTDVMGRNKIETKNAIGQTIFVTEADNTADEVTTEYRYDAAGNLKETQIAGRPESLVWIEYDERGRKSDLHDPDMGHWQYAYNSFGELAEQADALGQTTRMEYNKLGQLTRRTDRFGSGSERISEWTFGNTPAEHNVGKLESVEVMDPDPDGDGSTMNDPDSDSIREFDYDSMGRLSRTTDTVGSETFITEQSYDSAGRPDTLTYPATTQYGAGFKVKHVYKSNGYLETVQTPDASKVFWRADELNARGQLVAHTLGNGISTTRVYDSATGWVQGILTEDAASDVIQHMSYAYFDNGSLESRTDYRQSGLSEDFTYDNLNRLSASQVSGQTLKTYNYDLLGNIAFKTGVGHYKYGADCAIPAGLHAVCEIRSEATGGSLLKSYEYDANGNADLSAGREVDYTGFNKPVRFMEGASTQVSFVYGADLNRIFQETVAPGKHSKTYYVGLGDSGGALFESETDVATGHRENRHYIYAGGASPIAMHVVKDSGSATLSISNRYFHHDHLGSVEAISDDGGLASAVVYMSYDAWGGRRNPDWTDATGGLTYVDGARGFTGHEDLPGVGLIHMNGRVYDPMLGRFQSADPYMQPAELSQGMNRYGYVLNNPLTNIDPTGYKSIFRRAKDSIQREWKEFWRRDLKPFLNRLTRHCTGCGAGYDSSQGFHVGAESSPYGTYRSDDSISFEIGSAAESALTVNQVNPATAAENTIAVSSEGEGANANASASLTQGETLQQTGSPGDTSVAMVDETINQMSGCKLPMRCALEQPQFVPPHKDSVAVAGFISTAAGLLLATENSVLTATGGRMPRYPLYYGMDIQIYNRAVTASRYFGYAGTALGVYSYSLSSVDYARSMASGDYRSARKYGGDAFYGALMMAPPYFVTIPVGLIGMYTNHSYHSDPNNP